MSPILSIILFPLLTSAAIIPRQATTVTVYQTPPASAPTSSAWDVGAVTDYNIHSSCNATERGQIRRGLNEATTLAQHAKDHILRWGNESDIYVKYFGNASSGEPIGWFDRIVSADKKGVLFRCDDPDQNCATQDSWAGHWRGSNASAETVICPLSYELRKPLEAMCGFGYTVANGATNFYWASDLLHRLYHIPKISEGVVEHYAGEYNEVVDLAVNNATYAARNSDTLQYFALEAYAFDIAVPGEGCAGRWTSTSSEAVATPTPSPSSTDVVASATEPTPTGTPAEDDFNGCEPHDDHWHCPPGVEEPDTPPPA